MDVGVLPRPSFYAISDILASRFCSASFAQLCAMVFKKLSSEEIRLARLWYSEDEMKPSLWRAQPWTYFILAPKSKTASDICALPTRSAATCHRIMHFPRSASASLWLHMYSARNNTVAQ